MTATFGDFSRPASEHITAAVFHPGDLPDEARPGVIRQLDRIVTTLAHHLADAVPADRPATGPADPLDPSARAAVEARTALRRAAHILRHGATSLEGTDGDADHPVVTHLTAAADNLAAGRDVLQSHFARGPYGGWEGTSYWAPAITSRPVTAALMGELARHARTLAPWAARLSVSGWMDAGAPATASLDLHTATRWLWIAGGTLEQDLRQHPPSGEGCRLLAAIPANFPPPRQASADGESVPELCRGIAVTAERLRHIALRFSSRARWSPAPSSTTWRKNALAAAITGHASQMVLQSLSGRADQLGLDAAIQSGLRAASQELQEAWSAWRAIAHGWDIISTGRRRSPQLAPVVPEFGDLAVQVARLAYRNPQWTAAIAGNGPIRDPASLAPTTHDLMQVLASIHHASDAVTRVGAEDQAAVSTATVDDRLYLPTRLMPDDCDIPRPYSLAPASRARELLTSYNTAITASTHAAITLDVVAIALGAPTWTLAALRAPSPDGTCNQQIIGPKARPTHCQPPRPRPRSQLSPVTERYRMPRSGHS
jgi:hypothetical protein